MKEEATWKKKEFSSFSPSKFRATIVMGTCDCSLSLLRPFSFSNLRMRFCFRREGCNTTCI
jgi:hypothetical protein